MAQIIQVTPEHQTEIFDSDTNNACLVEKVVDVTDDCPNRPWKIVFIYTRAKRGRIIKMIDVYDNYTTLIGASIHFFIDELDKEMNVRQCDDTFGSWAKKLGLTKGELYLLIKTHAPKP